jgi:hypothetical protein
VLAALAVTLPTAVTAQTTDEARLVVGIAAGWIGGHNLWGVPRQPLLTPFPGVIDTLALSRDIRSNITLSGQMTYFRGDHFGLTAEFTYVGLGFTDYCAHIYDTGNQYNGQVCTALDNREEPASAVTLGGGITYRPTGRTHMQPYARGVVGVTLMPRSTRSVVVDFFDANNNLTEGQIYVDNHWTELRPTGTLGIGIATAPSLGYQLRVEFRETFVHIATVTGATPPPYAGFDPPSRGTWLALPSLMVGFDIVLAKSRGRRY